MGAVNNQQSASEPAFRSLSERVSEQFHHWESRGRGWLLWEEAVRPEPPFTPFLGYELSQTTAQDDGQVQTWISGLTQWVSRLLVGKPQAEAEGDDSTDLPVEEQQTLEWVEPAALVELQVTLPAASKMAAGTAEQFLLSVAACRHALAFEVIGLPEETILQFVCADTDASHVRSQLQAHFPDAGITENDHLLAERWEKLDEAKSVVIEFGLSREFMLPLADTRTLDGDFLVGVAAAMEQVTDGELGLLQIMFEPVRNPWAQNILRAVATSGCENLFGGTVDVLGQAKAKVARPLYAAVVRVACRSKRRERAWELARHIGRLFDRFGDPLGNELIALDDDEYDPDDHASDVPLRRCRRSGMILNSTELAAWVHPPTPAVQTPKLARRTHRTKAAPASVAGHQLILGENEHRGQVREVTLDAEHRVRHMHVIGASGTGKSTFLQNLILQDLHAGQGIAVLDPHGDLIDSILQRVPARRVSDVVLFDPSDEAYPIGFNILTAHSESEKTLLSSDLVAIFRRLSTSWGDQMNAVLGNAVLAFLESNRGGTLSDLRRFLVEPRFREEFLRSVGDPQIVYYWRKEFPLLVGRRPQGPVLTRLDAFLRPKSIRHVVSQQANKLDFADIMDKGKIFLARLSHGGVGEENAQLLGALLVSKFHQLALGRQQVKESARRDFWLYIDEFQHFATPSMASLLSGVRKYRLGLVLAHQELHQLESRSPEVASAVLGNVHTRVCFRLGDQDARKLESGFASFEASDLQNLSIGEAICRVERAEYDFNLHTRPLEAVDPARGEKVRDEVVALSRAKYAVAREVVEAQLREGMEEATAEAEPRAERPTAQRQRSEESPPARDEAKRSPKPTTTPPTPSPIADIPEPPAASEPPKPKRDRVPAEQAVLGRGGQQHKYLQQLIKQWAEGLGYRATIEAPILGGQGSVDVALEKPHRSIACLVSVTTSDRWELASVRKCLEAKAHLVALVCPDAKHLSKLRTGIEPNLSDEERQQVRFFLPEELFAHVQELELKDLEQERTTRGYKVKTKYKSLDATDSDERRNAISEVVAKSIKRSRDKKR
jgi:hypothetical protein